MNTPRSDAEREFDRVIGRAIMRARLTCGLSGAALAQAVDISQQRICWIEAGGRCSCFLLVKIAGVLKLDVAQLLRATSLICFSKKSRTRAS